MRTVTDFPRRVVETQDVAIVMPDGTRLSARVWMPEDALADPVPAILEYLPYRKRDGTAMRDALTHPWLAGHGYACLRVDARGHGESEGWMDDEYTREELQDGVEIIAWAAAQPWCSGAVGMMGISWGGFNSLQIAALRPPALKAIVTICSTDDRYGDDIHYRGGCLLNENLGWGATMFSYVPRPPDPLLVGERWRAMWMERLERNHLWHARWLGHPTRDAYWRHGSVAEDYRAIEAAVLAVGGWGDSYRNTVSRLVENLTAPVKGIVGPWIHKYPHLARPEPIGFLQEMRRWWDRWLKGIDTGVEDDPAMRLYLMDGVRPATWYDRRPGRWIAEAEWPSPNIAVQALHLTGEGGLSGAPAPRFARPVASPAHTGAAGGEFCAIWWGPDMPDDQRPDDALSACFDSLPLEADHDIVGGASLTLQLSADRTRAQVAVRLCHLHPDGASTRISWGVLNLCHRTGHEAPAALSPGQSVTVEIRLDDIAYRVPAGHRLRVAISSAYWPMIWPSPEAAMLTIEAGRLDLPVRPRAEAAEWAFEAPEAAPPRATEPLRPETHVRRFEHDARSGERTLLIEDDFGRVRDLETGRVTGSRCRERWTIHPDDPLSARGECWWEQEMGEGADAVRVVAETTMTSDAASFRLTGQVTARDAAGEVFRRGYEAVLPRGFL
jgi:hypothetical protein